MLHRLDTQIAGHLLQRALRLWAQNLGVLSRRYVAGILAAVGAFVVLPYAEEF